ncbi:hypothetical protein EV361DRAFT_1015988 [Lentinula raphanica]|nr:hypothetical protein EV361DRAFT_1015988 [Lentinula raphanica]
MAFWRSTPEYENRKERLESTFRFNRYLSGERLPTPRKSGANKEALELLRSPVKPHASKLKVVAQESSATQSVVSELEQRIIALQNEVMLRDVAWHKVQDDLKNKHQELDKTVAEALVMLHSVLACCRFLICLGLGSSAEAVRASQSNPVSIEDYFAK